jgi:hydroperoxide dehydratase
MTEERHALLTLQLHPITRKVITPWPIEDFLLHTFHMPAFLVRGDYAALPAYFAEAATALLDEAERRRRPASRTSISSTTWCFMAIFNAYNRFKIFLPHMVKCMARVGLALHAMLADEVRAACPEGGEITVLVEDMVPLVKSVVWETLRMNLQVEFHYGRARQDLVAESHGAAYQVRKGEMLYSPWRHVTRACSRTTASLCPSGSWTAMSRRGCLGTWCGRTGRRMAWQRRGTSSAPGRTWWWRWGG